MITNIDEKLLMKNDTTYDGMSDFLILRCEDFGLCFAFQMIKHWEKFKPCRSKSQYHGRKINLEKSCRKSYVVYTLWLILNNLKFSEYIFMTFYVLLKEDFPVLLKKIFFATYPIFHL